jgi:hypothetical protein
MERETEDGISLIMIYSPNRGDEAIKAVKALHEVLQGMPLRIVRLDVVHKGDSSKPSNFFDTFLPHALKSLLISSSLDGDRKNILQANARVHFSDMNPNVIKSLSEEGYYPALLPSSLGGRWTMKHHNLWLLDQTTKDIGMKTSSYSAKSFSFPGRNGSSTSTTTVSLYSAEAMKSKEKRARHLCRAQSLEIQTMLLREQQSKLQKDNLFLEKTFRNVTDLLKHSNVNQLHLSVQRPSARGAGQKRCQTWAGLASSDRMVRRRKEEEIAVQSSRGLPGGTGNAFHDKKLTSTFNSTDSALQNQLNYPNVAHMKNRRTFIFQHPSHLSSLLRDMPATSIHIERVSPPRNVCTNKPVTTYPTTKPAANTFVVDATSLRTLPTEALLDMLWKARQERTVGKLTIMSTAPSVV